HLDSLPVADFFNRVHHEDVQRLQAAFDDAFAGNGVLDEMFRIVLPGGTTHWVSARGQQVGGSDRERRMIGALTDVSERVQA
ncbi:PAS domain-containing protein, partial [Mycobacterium tuberculosis]|nr:PAS domain-containing protein [Mycobacterium tuberculosis]